MRVPTWLLAISCALCVLAALAVGRQPPPRAASVRARAAAQAVVERGVAAGRWADGDVLALRPLLALLGDQDRQDVTRELIVALNGGKVRVETRLRPPF
jgi:hypothetical protein